MNQASCDSSGCCWSELDTHPIYRRNCYSWEPPDPKSFSIPGAQRSVTEWHVTAKYLSTYIAPSQLNFVFICDVQDLETAPLALNLSCSMKKLLSCQICLAKDLWFKSLVKEVSLTVFRLTSLYHYLYPFLKLLVELYLAILSFTNLVALG
jgi:hypothetical protein